MNVTQESIAVGIQEPLMRNFVFTVRHITLVKIVSDHICSQFQDTVNHVSKRIVVKGSWTTVAITPELHICVYVFMSMYI